MVKTRMNPDDETRRQLVLLIPRLRRFARVLTANMADADDVVQASLEKAMINLAQWQTGTRLDSWLFRIARNVWLDDRRRAHNRIGHDDINALSDHVGDDGDAAVAQGALARQVRTAIDRLPPEQRDLVGLIMLEGHTYREAAELFDVPIGTVMSRLSRAKAALARELEDEGQEV